MSDGVKRSTPSQPHPVARDLGMTRTDEDATSLLALTQGSFGACDAIDAMPDDVPAVTYPRTLGKRPAGDDSSGAGE